MIFGSINYQDLGQSLNPNYQNAKSFRAGHRMTPNYITKHLLRPP